MLLYTIDVQLMAVAVHHRVNCKGFIEQLLTSHVVFGGQLINYLHVYGT